jgi:hypothetical protein
LFFPKKMGGFMLAHMKKLLFPFLALFTSCASYNATALNSSFSPMWATKQSNVELAAHVFNKHDCKKYLDRDVIAKGYMPIQLFIQNNSDKCYLFSPNRVSLPCASSKDVAGKVHTSTVGRAAGYGAAAFLTCGLFAIPAVVDGVKSMEANDMLDEDFAAKGARDQVIEPYSHATMLLFVPTANFQSSFDVTLIEKESESPSLFHVKAS